MVNRFKKKKLNHQISITIAFVAIVMLVLFSSCGDKHKIVAAAISNRDSLPVMETLGVSSLISDSGVIRYRVTTPKWDVFDRKRPPYWAFEKGVYLEQFDSLLKVQASIRADTAYYYDQKKLWRLSGHVDIKNIKGERFTTALLFWDQALHKVYSNALIHIKQPDRTIIGHGFNSNEQMTIYTINNIEGVFHVNENSQVDSTNSAKSSSVKVVPMITPSVKQGVMKSSS